MPTETSTNMTRNLVELGEYKLAIRVILCDAKTEYIALKSKQMARKIARHNRKVTKQENAVDRLAEDIPRIVMEHQNRKK